MPYARRRRGARRRRIPARPIRVRRKPKPKSGPITTVFRGPNGIPDRLIAKFPYAQTFSLSTSTSPATQLFRNSMFDPDYSGVGHQPFMRDEIAALYNKYKCFGFKYEVTINNNSSTDTVRYAVFPVNHTGGPSSMDLAWEKPYAKWGLLSPDTGSKNMVTIRGYLSAPKALQVTKATFNREKNYWADKGSSPAAAAYLAVVTQAANGTTSLTCRVTVRLTMYTMYFERAINLGS